MRWLSLFGWRRTPERQNRKRTSYASVNGRPVGATWRSPLAVGTLAVVAGGLAAWGLGVVAHRSYEVVLATHPFYRIRTLDIRSDGPQVTPERVRQWTGLQLGMSLLEPDVGALRAMLIEKVPVIREATVSRYFPDRLAIRISERIPVVALGRSGFLGADASGHVFSMAPGRETLPCVVGYSEVLTPGRRLNGLLMNAVEVVEAARRPPLAGLFRIVTVDTREPDWLTLGLEEGPWARLSWEGMKEKPTPQSRLALEQKLRSLARILEDARLKGRKLKTVDLTFSDDYIPVE